MANSNRSHSILEPSLLLNGIIPFLSVSVWQSAIRWVFRIFPHQRSFYRANQSIVLSKLLKARPIWWPLRDWCIGSCSCSLLTVRFSIVLARITRRPIFSLVTISLFLRRPNVSQKNVQPFALLNGDSIVVVFQDFDGFRTYDIGYVEIDERRSWRSVLYFEFFLFRKWNKLNRNIPSLFPFFSSSVTMFFPPINSIS